MKIKIQNIAVRKQFHFINDVIAAIETRATMSRPSIVGGTGANCAAISAIDL